MTDQSQTIRTAPPEVANLVSRFSGQRDVYKSGKYNETQLRRDFLDQLFEALGWDVGNRKNLSETNRDVINEISVEMEGHSKAADYAFKTNNKIFFFLEAKKPSVNIESNPAPAFQLRSYGWTAKVPFSILSDFEQLAIYDCRIKPVYGDTPLIARHKLYSYTDYVDKWDEIYNLLSYDAVHQGSLDKLVETVKSKRGSADVDDDFLATMEHWREELARVISLRNLSLSQRQINTAVQLIIDRIIFLRICEDRGIEPENALREATDGVDVYGDLMALFKKADKKYNSGLFHFEAEKGQSSYPDTLTPTLKIDDKVLKDILANLYLPKSPYAFKYFSADILGQVYERFLGKVITLSDGHRSKIIEKPEVRKAGGVYYTPTYIVDYIVKNTVGELLKDKTPAHMLVEPIRVLDPACGSGSFLLGAYQYLLDWYLDWYTANDPLKWSKGKNPPIFDNGGWQLTMEKKKEILTSHIYGVDIDAQAVEVTKLSLLLKVVENPGQLSLIGERILPDLGENIKCGNSLIGPDYYENQQLTMFDSEEQYRVNAFDWHNAFPKAFKVGGFDAVIGNPPYGASVSQNENMYYRERYDLKDKDTYALFIEKAINTCRENGLISMIVPTGWYSGASYINLRRYFATTSNPLIFVNLPYDIFGAWVDTTIFVTEKRKFISEWPRKDKSKTKLVTFPKRFKIQNISNFNIDSKTIDITAWFDQSSNEFLTYTDTLSLNILRKIENISKPLSELADVQRGVTPFPTTEKPIFPTSKLAFTGTVRRYIFENEKVAYIKYDKSLAEFKPEKYFVGPRLLLRELISRQFRLQAVKVYDDFVTNKSMQSILMIEDLPNLSFILGILNSKLLSWYFLSKSNIGQRDDFPKIVLKETRLLPILAIDFSKAAEVKQHDRMVALVESMLALHKQSAAARLPDEKERLARQIQTTDRQIDKLVYELYGLTEDEIRIVESTS